MEKLGYLKLLVLALLPFELEFPSLPAHNDDMNKHSEHVSVK
jgi:hypothetical protein